MQVFPRWCAVTLSVLCVSALAGCSSDSPLAYRSGVADAKGQVQGFAAKAFAAHSVTIPAGARGLTYDVRENAEGTPFGAEFSVDCGGVPAFAAQNSLTSVAYYLDLPNTSVYDYAKSKGWTPITDGPSPQGLPMDVKEAQWFQRPAGHSADLQVLVQLGTVSCHVYLTAAG